MISGYLLIAYKQYLQKAYMFTVFTNPIGFLFLFHKALNCIYENMYNKGYLASVNRMGFIVKCPFADFKIYTWTNVSLTLVGIRYKRDS